METAAISHRVADFLKKHPPFHAIGGRRPARSRPAGTRAVF